jgi:hypothetical protein
LDLFGAEEGEGGREAVRLRRDAAHAVRDGADSDDTVPVADVTVVENEVVGRAVVADVVDVGVCAFGDTLGGEGPGECGDLLDAVVVLEGEGERQLCG